MATRTTNHGQEASPAATCPRTQTRREACACGGCARAASPDLKHRANKRDVLALLDLIEQLVPWSRNHRLLAITLARPELLDTRPAWGTGQAGFGTLTLGPLSDTEMRQLLGKLMPSLPNAALTQVLERAGGVPLYGVEFARMLSDAAAASPDHIPGTLHSLVAARIDALRCSGVGSCPPT